MVSANTLCYFIQRDRSSPGITLNDALQFVDKLAVGAGSLHTPDEVVEALETGVPLIALGRKLLMQRNLHGFFLLQFFLCSGHSSS